VGRVWSQDLGDREERKRGAVDVGPHAAAGGLDFKDRWGGFGARDMGDREERKRGAVGAGPHAAAGGPDFKDKMGGFGARTWAAARSVSEEQWT
jgi:hypothetical protein